MTISSLLRVLWRRRLVVIPMAVLSFGMCVAAVLSVFGGIAAVHGVTVSSSILSRVSPGLPVCPVR